MRSRSPVMLALPVAALLAFWGCAGHTARVDPYDSYWYGTPNSVRSVDPHVDYSQVEQQLATLTTQLTASLPADRVRRIAVLAFENTTGQGNDPLGAYLTEKITHLLYAHRPATIVERTFLHKVMGEIERGYSGRFDEPSLKEVGHLLNADTLVLGSYTRLANGTTEIMARAVSVETGEVMGASTATIASGLVPNSPASERQPLLAKLDVLPSEGKPVMQSLEGSGGGTYNVVPSPIPMTSYSTPQYQTYPVTPAPPIIIPPSYAPAWSTLYPSYPMPRLSRPWGHPRSWARLGSGQRGRRR